MENFVSRRPMFLADERLQAYELALNDGLVKYLDSEAEQKKLPSEILHYMFGFLADEDIRKRPVFMQVDPELISQPSLRKLLRQNVTLFMPEPVEMSTSLTEAIGDIKHAGFKIAFGDYAVDEGYELLLDYAHYVVVNYSERDEQRRRITPKFCHPKNIQVVAYEIQSRSDFENAREEGYDLFHGPFYYDPKLIEKDEIPAIQSNMMELLVEINRMDINYDKVAGNILKVKNLDSKLIEFVNSPKFKLPQKITSITQAMTMMGVTNLRQWATISTIVILGERSMSEQAQVCLARGRFLEVVGEKIGPGGDLAEHLFFAGIYSMAAFFLQRPLSELLGTIPLDRSIRSALLGDAGQIKTALDLAVAVESGDWDAINKHGASLKVLEVNMARIYFDALRWARETLSDYNLS